LGRWALKAHRVLKVRGDPQGSRDLRVQEERRVKQGLPVFRACPARRDRQESQAHKVPSARQGGSASRAREVSRARSDPRVLEGCLARRGRQVLQALKENEVLSELKDCRAKLDRKVMQALLARLDRWGQPDLWVLQDQKAHGAFRAVMHSRVGLNR